MKKLLTNLIDEEEGQDLIEYTLLLAFVVMSSAAILTGAGSSVKGVWTVANSRLAAANVAAS